jgi:hypothetical protein
VEHQVNDLAAVLRELSSGKTAALSRKEPADLGEMLETGLPNLREKRGGFDLPELHLADAADGKKQGGATGDGSGPLDIAL